MRVLHLVSSSQLRGAETFASDLNKALADRGVEQRVAMLRAAPGAGVRFQSPTEVLGREAGPALGRRPDLVIMRSLRRLLSTWAPDIVQTHGGETLKYAIPACGRRAGVVYRRIGSTPEWMAGSFRRAGHRALMRRAARIVAVADAVRAETIERFGIEPSRVITIPNGVDLARATPIASRHETRARLGVPSSALTVITVGAFTQEKDPEAHVEVARRVLERRPDAVFLLVGDGPLLAETRRAIERNGLEHSVRLLGLSDAVPDLLASGDVLLLASRTEGMPGVLIEAGIAGLPAAAFAVAGVPEVVDDGRTGSLAPPGDVAALAGRVLTLLGDERARLAMGEAARSLCIERFDIRVIARRYLDLYEQLSGSPTRRGRRPEMEPS